MTTPLRTALRAAALSAGGAMLLTAATGVMREAAPTAHTGGFGEPTCHACHFQAPVNSGGGSVAIHGLPERWEPGASYGIDVALQQVGLALGGFQLAARFADGSNAGTLDAGPDPERVRVATFRDVQYAGQTWDGALPDTDGAVRWTLRWTAPADPAGDVSFHVAANAANDDDSPLGDFVYTASLTVAGPKTRR